jgi:hypothetical protein
LNTIAYQWIILPNYIRAFCPGKHQVHQTVQF